MVVGCDLLRALCRAAAILHELARVAGPADRPEACAVSRIHVGNLQVISARLAAEGSQAEARMAGLAASSFCRWAVELLTHAPPHPRSHKS